MNVWRMFGLGWGCASLVVAGLLGASGCSRDVHLAGRKIPHVTVGPVTVDGVTLDKDASPTAVAFAALRAIRDDFKAATPDERQAALSREFDLCAADVIQKYNRTTFGRDEFVYNVVYRWTPTVSYYVGDFPKDWKEAQRRLVVQPVAERDRVDSEVDEVAVALDVVPPSGDERARVVLMIWLAKDDGFWRVVHLGFDQHRRSIDAGSSQASLDPARGM